MGQREEGKEAEEGEEEEEAAVVGGVWARAVGRSGSPGLWCLRPCAV